VCTLYVPMHQQEWLPKRSGICSSVTFLHAATKSVHGMFWWLPLTAMHPSAQRAAATGVRQNPALELAGHCGLRERTRLSRRLYREVCVGCFSDRALLLLCLAAHPLDVHFD
jgi:hypothetical protein